MKALQPEAALVLLPGKKRLAGKQGRRPAAPLHPAWAPAGRGDEVHPVDQHAARVLLSEQYGLVRSKIHECGTEGAGEAPALGLHQVDVRLAVDLRAAEEKDVDPPLPRKIEQLARAFGKGVAPALLQQGNSQRRIFLLQKKSAASGDRGSRADRDMIRVADQARDDTSEKFLISERRSHPGSA